MARRVQATLEDYAIQAVTEGPESLATTRVTVTPAGRVGSEAFVTSAQVWPPPSCRRFLTVCK